MYTSRTGSILGFYDTDESKEIDELREFIGRNLRILRENKKNARYGFGHEEYDQTSLNLSKAMYELHLK